LDPSSLSSRIRGKMVSLSFVQKIFVMALITLLAYGSSIAINELVISDIIIDFAGPPADLDVYRNRTQAIIDGDLLYRDVHTETPPLINYLMVPAQLLGGESWIYSAYFSLFSFLGGFLLYFALRRWNEMSAFLVGILFILSPFGLVEATFGVEDETLATFVFLIPLVLLLHNRHKLAALFIGVGIWTKMFSILHYPVLFLKEKKWNERVFHILMIVAVTIVVVLPFLALCLEDFTWFLKFYLLGVEGEESGGISFWHFLEIGGFGFPGELSLLITISALLLAFWFLYKRRLPVWQSSLVILIVFFTFYPKIHLGYYLMPIAVLLVWAAEDTRIALRCFMVYAPLIICVCFSENSRGELILDYGWGWMVGFLLSLIATLVFIDTTRRVLGRPTFIDRAPLSQGE
jgi:uncharacterized membrane protein YidH (DUF202 family)